MNNTLHLAIKGQWFDMILPGEKTGECRDIRPYCNLRLLGKEYDSAIFRNSYAHGASSLATKSKTIRLGAGEPEWGAEVNKKYLVLCLGRVINKKNINRWKQKHLENYQ